MNKTSFIIVTFVYVTKCNALPQFFSLGIGFGSDDSPLTFHTSDSSQEAAPSFQSQPFSFQSPQSASQSQQSAPQSQQSSFQPEQSPVRSQQSSFQSQQPSFHSQQSSFQPQQSAFQSQQFQPQPSFQSSPATAAPPPARSAPAPPMFNKQAGQKVNSFRQSDTQQRVFSAPTQPSVPSFQRNFSQEPQQQQQQQQQSQRVNNAGSHQDALERNALHRQQLATVIEAHNKKTFSQFKNQVQEAPEIRTDQQNFVNEDNQSSTRRVKIPAKRPVEIDNFRGKPTPATKAPKFSTKALPESLREDIIEHLRLINSLDQQVNELVAKASRVFSTDESSALSNRKQFKQERINKVNNSEEDEPEIPEYETEVE